MGFDIESFRQSVEPQLALKAAPKTDEKLPVHGDYIIEQVWENEDVAGTFYVLDLTMLSTGEVGVPYILRYGDPPGLPFAEELNRELELGLIEMQYGAPPVVTTLPAAQTGG